MNEVSERFLAGDIGEQLDLVADPAHADELRALVGEDALTELRALAAARDEQHLAFGAPPNVVVVPGVMGSLLMSRTLGGVWWIDPVTRKRLNDLRVAPDGVSDADPTHEIEPFNVVYSYARLQQSLLDHPTLTHRSFAYDWRKPYAHSTERLRDEVLRLRDEAGEPIHLIAHSMGGLMVRAALMRHDELWGAIGKIVFLGTPHYGSPAIAGYLKNHFWGFDLLALLGRYIDRATFRSLRGVLSLLPAPAGIYPATRDGETPPHADDGHPHPTANFDLYDAGAWGLDLDEQDTAHLQAGLDAAAAFARDLYAWHMALDQERRDRMAVIAGVGFKTLFRLAYRGGIGGRLPFREMRKVTDRVPGDPHRDGDGRVPVASAALEHVGELRFARCEHGALAGAPEVSDDAFRFLLDEPMQLARSPQEALQPHLGGEATTTSPLRSLTEPDGDDPGYLHLEEPDEEELAALEARLDADELPAFRRLRIL